jgi:hypothetical protein
MIQTNDFINPGDEVRDKMNKSIEKSLVNNGLKEDTSYLNAKDLDFNYQDKVKIFNDSSERLWSN